MSQQLPPEEQVTRRRPSGKRKERDYYPPPKTRQHKTPPAEYDYDSPDPESSSLYVPWWGFALVILIVAGLTCGLWGVVLMNRDSGADGPTPTPIFVVITSTPTLGPSSEGTVPPTLDTPPTAEPVTPTDPTSPPELTAAISIGSIIAVTGTEGDGLKVRQGPGLDYQYIFVAVDGEQFEVQDGPREANGYVWWYIVDPLNPDRFGWAVTDFMVVAQ